jgi:hypothetical protein
MKTAIFSMFFAISSARSICQIDLADAGLHTIFLYTR